MASQSPLLFSFNRGEISTQLLGRTDLEHLRLAAQIQENWQPRVLGPMSLRPGSAFIGDVASATAPTKTIPFVAAFSDTALIELSPNIMRVWVSDPNGIALPALVTRASVATSIPNFSGWATSATGTAQVSATSGGLQFGSINIGAQATATATVSVASGDIAKEHAVRIVVVDGPINFQIGSYAGADDIFGLETLDTGTYSLAFTPGTTTIYPQFTSAVGPANFNTLLQTQPQAIQTVTVASIAIESAGVMTLPTPWGVNELAPPCSVRADESADVVFVACRGLPQRQIVRYSPTSWSVVLHKPVKGPMNAVPGDSNTLLSVNALTGNTTMTANKATFKPTDVGTLFRLFHNGQIIEQTLTFFGTHTDPIRVTGVSTISIDVGGTTQDFIVLDRTFSIGVGGEFYQLQRSFDGPTSGFNAYLPIFPQIVPDPIGFAITDYLDNEIIYYRITVTSDGINVPVEILYGGGGGAGVCRVTGYISPTEVAIEILVPFLNTGVASDWRQSEWGTIAEFPTSVALHEGRLWWAGGDRWIGSASDDYNNFDFDAIGDAAYIDVQIGQGPIADINWLVSVDSLVGGSPTSIIAARSDAIQSPLTPTNFNLRFCVSVGAAPLQAVKIDKQVVFVNQSGQKIFSAVYDIVSYNYKAVELSNFNPDIGYLGYVAMAVQRNPDTMVHLVRSDGQMVILLLDEQDQVKAFWRKTTLGEYVDVAVLPGEIEDQVFATVRRQNGKFLERFYRLDQTWGDQITALMDAALVYSGPPTTSISLPWLANQAVTVWADGQDLGVVQLDSSGNGTLPLP